MDIFSGLALPILTGGICKQQSARVCFILIAFHLGEFQHPNQFSFLWHASCINIVDEPRPMATKARNTKDLESGSCSRASEIQSCSEP